MWIQIKILTFQYSPVDNECCQFLFFCQSLFCLHFWRLLSFDEEFWVSHLFFLWVVWKCRCTISVEKFALIFIFDSLCVILLSNFWVPMKFCLFFWFSAHWIWFVEVVFFPSFFPFLTFIFFSCFSFHLFLFLLILLGLSRLFGSMVCLFLYLFLLLYLFFSFCDSSYTLGYLILSYGSWMHCSCFVLFCFHTVFLLCVPVWLIFIVSSLTP